MAPHQAASQAAVVRRLHVDDAAGVEQREHIARKDVGAANVFPDADRKDQVSLDFELGRKGIVSDVDPLPPHVRRAFGEFRRAIMNVDRQPA